MDSSALHPLSGICTISGGDTLPLSAYDGSFHLITDILTAPSLNGPTSRSPPSGLLCAAVRKISDRTERVDEKNATKVRATDVNRISGMISFDGGASAVWLYELVHPLGS